MKYHQLIYFPATRTVHTYFHKYTHTQIHVYSSLLPLWLLFHLGCWSFSLSLKTLIFIMMNDWISRLTQVQVVPEILTSDIRTSALTNELPLDVIIFNHPACECLVVLPNRTAKLYCSAERSSTGCNESQHSAWCTAMNRFFYFHVTLFYIVFTIQYLLQYYMPMHNIFSYLWV